VSNIAPVPAAVAHFPPFWTWPATFHVVQHNSRIDANTDAATPATIDGIVSISVTIDGMVSISVTIGRCTGRLNVAFLVII
jgi:hypothetical protein